MSDTMTFEFQDIAQNITIRVDPKTTDLNIYVGLEHLDTDSLRIRRKGTPTDVEGEKLLVRKGDIIFGKRRVYQRKVAIADFDGICSAHAMVLRPKEDTIIKELFPFFLQSDQFMNRALKISVGSLSPTINWKTLRIQEFTIPVKEQQNSITSLLWAVEDCILNNEIFVEEAERVKKVLMRDLLRNGIGHKEFKDIKKLGKVPANWNFSDIKSISKIIQSGFASGARDENGIIQLRMNNITSDGQISLGSLLKVPIPKNIDKYLLKKGDVIFNNTNSVDLIGKTAIFKGECNYCTFSNHLTRIEVINQKVLPEWLYYYLNQKWNYGYFKKICQRHVGQAGISGDTLKKMVIPLPPLIEQNQIVEILNQCNNTISAAQANHVAIKALKMKLINHFFSGDGN